MFFLLRMAFWVSVVLVLLPSGGSKQNVASNSDVGAIEAVSAASATVSDMRQFCTRQPEACAVGSQAAAVLGERAQAGAKMVYNFINERSAARDRGASDAKTTRPVAFKSNDTLTAADLAPAWRGARRDNHNKHGT